MKMRDPPSESIVTGSDDDGNQLYQLFVPFNIISKKGKVVGYGT